MNIGITYGNNIFSSSRILAQQSMEKYLDKSILYTEKDLSFYKDSFDPHIFNGRRGGGYWIFKSIFLNKTINEQLSDGDGIMWMDSGVEVKNDPKIFFDIATANKGFCLFKQPYLNKTFTKKDCFIYMDADDVKYTNDYMCDASIQFYIINDLTRKFLKEYLEYCSDARVLTDSNINPNIPGFIDHRHDQSILSILSTKYNLNRFKSPTQFYGNGFANEENIFNTYEKSINKTYNILFNHHRIRN